MRRVTSVLGGLVLSLLMTGSEALATPIPYNVDAFFNSSTGGAPVVTAFFVNSGDTLIVSAANDDCWSAGAADRTTNANGLVGHTTNACRPSAPTDYGLWSELGASLPFASLVGRIDGGIPFVLGTSFNQQVFQTGQLSLMFWDSNFADNSGFVTATVNVVPEPATLALVSLGLVALRRRLTR